MKKQPEITAKTKESLILAFCDLYSRKPIDKITVREITEQAGYNRGTFYQYFSDVYSLLACVENDLLKEMQCSLENGNDSIFNPNLHELFTFFKCKEPYLKAILGNYGTSHFITRLKEILPLDKLCETSSNKNIFPYLVEFHINTSLTMFRVWLQNDKNLSEEDLLALIHNLYTKGISSLTADE